MLLKGKELEEIVVGLSFFGCGGGGSREEGFEIVREIDEVRIVDLSELEEEEMIASPYACGSLDCEDSKGVFKEYKAVLELEEFLKLRFSALFPTELGAYNTTIVFKIAKMMGIPVIDGDGAGRAVPEIHHSIPSILGYRAVPASVVLSSGDTLIVKETEDDEKLERIIRHLVSKFGNVGVCDHPMKVEDAKLSLVKGSLKRSLEVGKAIMNRDLDSIVRITKSKLLMSGRIEKVELESNGGFTKGRMWIGNCTIHFKNENLTLECDDGIYRFPDMIILLNVEDLLPMENPPKEGRDVHVLIARADERWYGC